MDRLELTSNRTKKIKLILGDCLEMMRMISNESIDLVLTDPPYGITKCKWDSVISLEPMWVELKRVIKRNGAILLMASQPFTSYLIMSNIKMFKYHWVWKKSQATGYLNSYKMPMKVIEDICVFYSKLPIYNPCIKDKFVGNVRPDRKIRKKTACYNSHSKKSNRRIPLDKTLPTQLIEFNNCQENLHPTQKPVNLMEYLVNTYTNNDETVLDFAMGSGTTGIACQNLNRRFVGIELDEKYFKIAVERMKCNRK